MSFAACNKCMHFIQHMTTLFTKQGMTFRYVIFFGTVDIIFRMSFTYNIYSQLWALQMHCTGSYISGFVCITGNSKSTEWPLCFS